ncbi:MAG: EhaG family protein [Methanofollis sp.]|uniref:EhaG family protein n=1 Tax=Methanofollis sp. TaxID=2052835 RepID=UPI00260FA693|nr:EhaG family protein [Methanofollis sp.]MDD4255625.1 EhaG family protein [Methanofollis sp.]
MSYEIALPVVLVAVAIAFIALALEKDDLHRLLLTDLAEITGLAIIALVATDLAEALILPGLVVGISELMALSEVYLVKEGLTAVPKRTMHLEVMDSAPAILAGGLVVYGIILSGFSGGAVAGLGILFWFFCKGHDEAFEIIETASGYAWALWIAAFFVFMIAPQHWLFAVMIAGGAILLKVMAKMALVGTMRGGRDV